MKQFNMGLRARVRVSVLANSRVVREDPWQSNLILDQGLDKLATTRIADCFIACAAGTNNTATSVYSGATTATVTGQNLTASAPMFSTTDLDSDVNFDVTTANPNGGYAKIQSVTDASHVTLFTPLTVSAPTAFHVLRTNEVQLGSELKRTTQLSAVPAANQTVVSAASILLQRTFLFSPETSAVTYAEVGFSDLAAAGPNLFSRVVLANPVTVEGPIVGAPNGQQLQVTYQLTVNFDYGQGAGVFFTGRTPTTITVGGLPVLYLIVDYELAAAGGNLQVIVSPVVPVQVGDVVTIASSTVAAYNGTWKVLENVPWTDPTSGTCSGITLATAFTTDPGQDGGILETAQTGAFFLGCQAIFQINANGGTVAPPVTPDAFFGYGEPSIAGTAWIANDSGTSLGNNNAPTKVNSSQSVACQLLTYSKGSFQIDKQASFTVELPSVIYSFGVGLPNLTDQVMTWIWNQGQPLVINSTLVLTFRFSWHRTTF